MCSHMSCMSFVWQDAFLFLCSQMSSTSGDSDSGKGKRPVKRGKGQGGQKARYATQMTLAAGAAQYPNEPFTVKQTDAGERLWCLCCGKPVSHQTKTFVESHINNKSHQKNKVPPFM